MADEPTLEGSQQETPLVEEQPAVQPTESLTDDGVSVADTPEEAPSGQDDFVTIRDAAKELGYNVDGLDDDDSVIRRLVEEANTAQQVQPYLPHLNNFMQNAAAFEEYQRGQQAAPAPAEAPKPEPEAPLWDAPDFNPMWLSQVTQDEQGNIVPVPTQGGTPAVAQKVQEYFNWRSQKQDQFWQDPYAFMEPYLAQRETKLREKIAGEHGQVSAEEREEREAQQFVQDNTNWLYVKDVSGQIAVDPITQYPKFTEAGTKFATAIQDLEKRGVPRNQQRHIAMQMMGGTVPEQPTQSQPGSTPSQPAASPEVQDAQRKQEFLANAAGATPSAGASTIPTPDSNGNTQPQNERLTLDEMLTKDLAAAGITDQDLEGRY